MQKQIRKYSGTKILRYQQFQFNQNLLHEARRVPLLTKNKHKWTQQRPGPGAEKTRSTSVVEASTPEMAQSAHIATNHRAAVCNKHHVSTLTVDPKHEPRHEEILSVKSVQLSDPTSD